MMLQGHRLLGNTYGAVAPKRHGSDMADSRRSSNPVECHSLPESRAPRDKNPYQERIVGKGLHAFQKLTATAYMTGCVGQMKGTHDSTIQGRGRVS